MAYVTLADLKAHLKVEVNTDDAYLTSLIDVAEATVGNDLGKDLSYYADATTNKIPAPLYQAVMILCGDLYNNRESVAFATPSEVPRSYGYLIAPYKKYDVYCSTDIVEVGQ